MLTQEDKKKIASSILEIEKRVDSEIVVQWARQSSSYNTAKLVLGIFCTLFASVLLLLCKHFHNDFLIHHLEFFFAIQFLALVFGLFLLNVTGVFRFLIPKKYLQYKVEQAALKSFFAKGIYKTSRHSGILIYISHLEHLVQIIADETVHQKMEKEYWKTLAAKVSLGMRERNSLDTILEALKELEQKLLPHFPKKSASKNELSNEVIE